MSYNKKYKKPRESDKYLPKPSFVTSVIPEGYCERLAGVLLKCPHERRCWLCEYADRIQYSFGNDPPPYPLLDERSVFMDKSRIKYNYYGKVVAVKPATLERLNMKPLLYFQFFKCTDGFGCLPDNDVWEVDGYFLSDPKTPITLRRMDILGIPMLHACKKYDKYFFANTVRECGYLQGGGA